MSYSDLIIRYKLELIKFIIIILAKTEDY